nr:hypothetical protein [Tanacetum cinerariifolium]
MRTKTRVDTLNFDDLYNNIRVFEFDVKGSTRSSSSIQNVAFVSSNNTSSTNEVSTGYGVSTFFSHNLQKEGSSSYTDDLMYSFFSNQSSGLQLDHEDLEQVDEFDLEEMDSKWQIGHAEDDMKNYALMAFNSSNSGSDTEVTSCLKVCEESYAKLKKLYDEQREQLSDASIEIQAYTLALKRSSDVEDSLVNDRFAKVKGMHAVPPPMTGNYMPHKFNFGIDESKFTYGPKQSTTSESDAKTSDLDSCESSSSGKHLKLQATSTSTARRVNTSRTIVNEIKLRHNVSKSHSPIRSPLNRTTTPKANFAQHKVNTVGDKSVSDVGGKWATAVKASAVSAVGGKWATAVKASAGCN